MRQYGYLVVEGQHDIAFTGQLLRKVFGFGLQIRLKRDVDPFWNRIIPNKFPGDDDDLLKRVPVPAFFQKDTHSIAIHAALGITQMVETLDRTYNSLEVQPASYGFLLDADDAGRTPKQRFDGMLAELQKYPFTMPANPGLIAGENPAFGVYILPDNQNSGTLEDILLQSAQVNYTDLASAAQNYLLSFNRERLTHEDLEDFGKPAGGKKAHLGSMASVLKPGKAIQVSIQDNRWLEGGALALPSVKAISDFLSKLFLLD